MGPWFCSFLKNALPHLQRVIERAVQQRLKQMLRLPFRFPLLCAQTLKLLAAHRLNVKDLLSDRESSIRSA